MGRDWQALVVPITLGELIAQGYLSRFRVYAPDMPDLSGVALRRGDYAEAALQTIRGRAPLMGSVVRTWLEKGQDRPTLCFAVNRAHAQQLAAEFERHGIAAAHVDAYTDMVARQRITEAFRTGEIRVICSVRTMTTGVDLPVSCIIDAAPTRSEILHVQKIGRGLRVSPGTEDCLILDHAGNSLRLGLVTDIHHASLDDGTSRRDASRSARPERLPTACPACGVLFTGRFCPVCDHERRPVCCVEAAAGELVPLAGSAAPSELDDPRRFYRMALGLDARRGKGGKLALRLFKDRFGCWPRFGAVKPVEPDRAFLNWETSRRIAYARARSRREHELA